MSDNRRKSFLFNLLVVLLLCAGLYILFFTSLGWITRHGEEIKIPSEIGKDAKTAQQELEAASFEVYADSIYDPKQKPFVVMAQMPEAGSAVKKGRTIFITVNRAVPPMIPMPNLVSLSYRSAEMILRNNKLLLGDTTYKPDIAKGAILKQLFKGEEIRPGQMIAQGSKISLVIGDGLGITQFNVPDAIGMTYDEGTNFLSGSGLGYTPIWEGDITDSSTAIIFNQSPKPKNDLQQANRIKAGDVIDIYIKQNPTQDEMEHNRSGGAAVNGGADSSNNQKDDQTP